MSLEYFAGFGDETESNTVATNTFSEESAPTSCLERDVSELLVVRQHLLDAGIEHDIVRSDTDLTVNVDKNPFNFFYMEKINLRQSGYGIHIVDNAVDDSGRDISDDCLGVYIESASRSAVGQFDSAYFETSLSEQPLRYRSFLYDVTNMHLHANARNNEEKVRDMLLNTESPSQAALLMSRGILTSILLGRIEAALIPNYEWRINAKDDETYETLAASGIRPFNPEELYGMSAHIIREVRDRNPDLPLPPRS